MLLQINSANGLTWNICLHEHFVKAGEIIIARELGQTERTEKMMNESVKDNYRYLPQITKQLKIYNEHKDRYKSYNNYIINVIQHLKPVENKVYERIFFTYHFMHR